MAASRWPFFLGGIESGWYPEPHSDPHSGGPPVGNLFRYLLPRGLTYPARTVPTYALLSGTRPSAAALDFTTTLRTPSFCARPAAYLLVARHVGKVGRPPKTEFRQLRLTKPA